VVPVNLPTELLRSFITVSDLGGYTKAGKVLNRSQPAISLQMRRLENIVGVKLIVHSKKQLRFTEAGIALLAYARQILHLNDAAVAQFRPTDVSGTLRIGLPTDYAVSYLQETLVQFLADHPDSNVEVCCDLSANLLESLHSDQLNLVVALVGEERKQYLVHTWEERPFWVVGKTSAAHKQTPLPLVGHFENCEYRRRMTQALKQKSRQWHSAYMSPEISGVQQAVEAGLGVTALTRATLTDGMRTLTEKDGFPELEKIRVGLFFKLPRMSAGGRELATRLIASIDKSTDEHFVRASYGDFAQHKEF